MGKNKLHEKQCAGKMQDEDRNSPELEQLTSRQNDAGEQCAGRRRQDDNRNSPELDQSASRQNDTGGQYAGRRQDGQPAMGQDERMSSEIAWNDGIKNAWLEQCKRWERMNNEKLKSEKIRKMNIEVALLAETKCREARMRIEENLRKEKRARQMADIRKPLICTPGTPGKKRARNAPERWEETGGDYRSLPGARMMLKSLPAARNEDHQTAAKPELGSQTPARSSEGFQTPARPEGRSQSPARSSVCPKLDTMLQLPGKTGNLPGARMSGGERQPQAGRSSSLPSGRNDRKKSVQTPMTSFTIAQTLEERRTAMEHVQKARVAAKLEKEMSASPSTPPITRGPRKTQERPRTPGNPRRNTKTSRKVMDIAKFFEPSQTASKRPDTQPVTDNNTAVYQAAKSVQPMRGQERNHVTKKTRDEPTRAKKIRIDQNPSTGGHLENRIQTDTTQE